MTSHTTSFYPMAVCIKTIYSATLNPTTFFKLIIYQIITEWNLFNDSLSKNFLPNNLLFNDLLHNNHLSNNPSIRPFSRQFFIYSTIPRHYHSLSNDPFIQWSFYSMTYYRCHITHQPIMYPRSLYQIIYYRSIGHLTNNYLWVGVLSIVG